MEEIKLTVRKKPFQGEALSSYLFRLSKANGIQLLSLLNSLRTMENHFIQRNDIGLLDFSPYSLINLKTLSIMNNTQEKDMLLLSFYNALKSFRSEKAVQRSRFISGMLRDHFCYCPLCLLENPYFRILWKIKDISICPKHKIKLEKTCVACNKEIKLENQSDIILCPNCDVPLAKALPNGSISDEKLKQQRWLEQSWNTLFYSFEYNLTPHESAIRILYILNSFHPEFHRDYVESNMVNPKTLPSLLQYARGSLAEDRTLHLSFIFRILYENGISMKNFLELNVEESFIKSIRSKNVKKSEQYFCMAPWCSKYGQRGSLVRTGTSFKRYESGTKLYYYLACLECGCEYGVTESGELVERTSFITGFNILKNINGKGFSLKKLANKVDFTDDKLKRYLAYFHSRSILMDLGVIQTVNNLLVKKFVKAVKNNETIKSIKTWDCWESYNHFLAHRFQQDVITELIQNKRPRKQKNNKEENNEKVQKVVDQLFDEDKDITIATVSEMVGVCPETLRNWGCNSYIAKKKEMQKEYRLSVLKERIYKLVEDFFESHQDDNVDSDSLYQFLGIRRTILWRKAPEITAFIGQLLLLQNKNTELLKR